MERLGGGDITFAELALGGQGEAFARFLCVKREAFAHESEVRLLFHDVAPAGSPRKGAVGVFEFPLAAADVFDEVVVDPRLKAPEAASAQARLRAVGWSADIAQSTLYRAPRFTIPLE